MSPFNIHVHERRYRVSTSDPSRIWRVIRRRTNFERPLGEWICCRGKNMPSETPGILIAFLVEEGYLKICYRVDFKPADSHVLGEPDDMDRCVKRLLSLWGLPPDALEQVTTPYTEVYGVLPSSSIDEFVAQNPPGKAGSVVAARKPQLEELTSVEQRVTFKGTRFVLPATGVLYRPLKNQTPEVIKLELRYEPDNQGPRSKIHRFPEALQELPEDDILEGLCFHLNELTRGFPRKEKPELWSGYPLARRRFLRMGKHGKSVLLQLYAANSGSRSLGRNMLEQCLRGLGKDARARGNLSNDILNRLQANGLVWRRRYGATKDTERVSLTPRGEFIAYQLLLNTDKAPCGMGVF